MTTTGTYTVCDGHGTALTTGLEAHEAERVAQRMATERRESVWMSGPDIEGDREITPMTQTQRRPCPVCAGTAVVPGTRDLPCPTCAPGRLAAILTPRPQEG